jgi:hypothetical protein
MEKLASLKFCIWFWLPAILFPQDFPRICPPGRGRRMPSPRERRQVFGGSEDSGRNGAGTVPPGLGGRRLKVAGLPDAGIWYWWPPGLTGADGGGDREEWGSAAAWKRE